MRRAKLLLLIFGVLGLGVVAVFCVVFKDVALETWYLSELESEDEDRRLVAVERLGELKSRQAIPALVRVTIENPEVAEAAAEALKATGAETVPAPVRLVQRDGEQEIAEQNVSRQAANLVVGILKDHPEAIISVLRAYDPDSYLLFFILRHFLAQHGGDEATASVLIESMRDRDADVRSSFVIAIASLSRESPAARRVVLAGAVDKSDEVRISALNALCDGQESDEAFEDVIVRALKDANHRFRIAAAAALSYTTGTTARVHDAAVDAVCGDRDS